jgi:hypothetical protein
MATATGTAKRCVNCHKDVSNGKRMKDSSGRYWCVDCGTADQRKKGAGGELCGGCGERFPAAKLSKYGASKLCAGCIKRRNKGPSLLESLRAGRGGGGGTDKKRMVMMLAITAVLALVAVARFLKWF